MICDHKSTVYEPQLTVTSSHIKFTMSSKVHGHHPAVDPAAYHCLQPKTQKGNILQVLCQKYAKQKF